MRREPIFKRIKKISEAEPHELIEIHARAASGYNVKRYLVRFTRQGNTIIIDFYNKNGDAIWEDWGWRTKRYHINAADWNSSTFRANGCMHYLNKDEAYNDSINLLKEKKRNINKTIVDLQYALHSSS